jgi:hypothetical protein
MKIDEVGYWSELKLEIIKKYAAAYSQILSAQKQHLQHDYRCVRRRGYSLGEA